MTPMRGLWRILGGEPIKRHLQASQRGGNRLGFSELEARVMRPFDSAQGKQSGTRMEPFGSFRSLRTGFGRPAQILYPVGSSCLLLGLVSWFCLVFGR